MIYDILKNNPKDTYKIFGIQNKKAKTQTKKDNF